MNQTKKHTTGKKLLALLLALIMSVSLLPMSVFAADLGTEAPIVEGQTQQDAALDESSGEEEIVDSQEPVVEDPAPVEEDTTEDDVDTLAMEGDVAVQAAEISYVTKIGAGKKLDDSTFYRIVHIDCGRKYFKADDLKKIIDYAAASNYTHVELAFGNDGLRFLLDDMIVSVNGEDTDVTAAIQYGNKQFDTKASYSPNVTNEELSQSEMTDIIAYAKGKGIGIIPMFDVPGHLYAVIQAMQQKLGVDVTGYYEGPGSGSSPNWAISPTNVASVNFVQALVQKYITYFADKGCTMFNIAADESGISTTNYLAYAKLVNSVAAMVQNAGMVALAFNDGIYNPSYTSALGSYKFDSNIAICYWDAGGGKDYAQAATLAVKGFKIINTHNGWYYVIGKENITNSNIWSGYAYTCEYAKQQMSSENSCLNIDGDNKQTPPAGCMAAIWCDYPYNNVTWKNVESYIQTLYQYNKTYFTKVTQPEVTIQADKTTLKVGDTATLTLSSGDEASWSVEPADVIELSATTRAATATGATVTAKALKAGTATVTATVGNDKYETKITVTDVGDETYTSEETINLVIGETKDVTISGKNLSTDGKTYVTKDPSVATVTVTGEDEKPGDLKYNEVSVSYSTLAGSNSGWTRTQYYYLVNDIYYPVYAYRQYYYGYYYYYYYGYSTTDNASNVQTIKSSYNGNSTVRVYEQSGAQTVPASTTITFEGVNEGKTTVVIDNVLYTIIVTKEDTTNVSALPIQTWFTNCDIEVDLTAYNGGQTTGEFVSGSWQDNKKPYYVSVSAGDAYGKDGVPLSEVLPATMYRYENSNTYWLQEYSGKVKKELVLWSGRIHSSGNIQLISGKDYSNTGAEFQYVRYFGGTWAVSADRVKWTKVTGTGSTTSASTCTEQLAVYYMMRSKITTEVTTDVADWGYVKSDDNYSTQITAKQYVILDFAVKYEGGTRNPNTFPQDGKTFVFHCTPNDASGSVIEESSNVYYRQLNNFRGVNTSEYEIYMVTVTMTKDAAGDTLSSTTSYTYDGEERIVWAIDQETHDNCGLNDYQAITSGDTTYSGCKIGGDPYVRGVEVYNQHGALITYYIRLKTAPEDSLRVHYINKTTGEEFYNYSISVKQGTVFDASFDQVAPNSTELTGNTVENYLGFTETVIAELEKISGIGAQYRYSNYTCVDTSRNDDGKDVYLYYTFVTTKTFVVDFGLPVVIRPADIAERLSQANIERMSIVAKTKYADIERNNADFSFSYKLTATIDGQDDINVTYYGTNSENKPDNATYTVSMIPAANVYYEDSFAKFYGSDGAEQTSFKQAPTDGTDTMGTWYVDGNELTSMPDQALEELGKKNNVYGYDPAYNTNSTTFSMGSAKKVTVNAGVITNPTAQFTFKGTGFDVISLTDNRSGAITVTVTSADGSYSKDYFVDNYYGYSYENGKWVVNKNAEGLYQIPVMKVENLPYGEYTATITVFYNSFFNHTDGDAYSFWLDAIRVYNPMGVDRSEYTQGEEKEGYPQYIKLRNALADEAAVIAGKGKVVFIDGGNTGDIATYANYGPNNEVYLMNGQAISFKVPKNANIASIQIGAKAPQDNTTAKLSVDKATLKNTATTVDISTATEMYYELFDAQNKVVTIANDGNGILSLTNLKITFTNNTTISLAELTTQDQANAVAAVRALFAAPEPDPEPVTFEPERFEVSWNRSTVKVGQKATLTVKTSEDVDAITVDGEAVTNYRTRTQRTGWGWNAKKVTYREFTYTITAAEAGTLDVSVAAVSAEGVSSAAVTATVTVQAASQRPGIGGWLENIFGRWF